MREGGSILEFPNAWGGGKISMPPVVGVRIFSGTTHCFKKINIKMLHFNLCLII